MKCVFCLFIGALVGMFLYAGIGFAIGAYPKLDIDEVRRQVENNTDSLVQHIKEPVFQITDITVYDPNDPAYKFIPAAPADWIERFGDNERTRMLHTVSELRVVVGNIGRQMMDPNTVDPNEVAQ